MSEAHAVIVRAKAHPTVFGADREIINELIAELEKLLREREYQMEIIRDSGMLSSGWKD
jgi:hypothetical protein